MACESSTEAAKPFILKLPNELLLQIFDHFAPSVGKNRVLNYWLPLMLVCTRWYPVAQEVAFNHTKVCPDRDLAKLNKIMLRQPWVGRYIRTIKLQGKYNSDRWRKDVLPLLHSRTALRSLILGSEFSCSDQALFQVLRELPLTHLQITSFFDSHTLREVATIPTLKSLTVNYWGSPFKLHPDSRMRSRYFNKLSRLEYEKFITDSEVKTSKITSLHFKGPTVRVPRFKRLLMLPASLESITLDLLRGTRYGVGFSSADLTEILSPQAAFLKDITLISMPHSITTIPIPDLTTFPSLEKITLWGGDVFRHTAKDLLRRLTSASVTCVVIDIAPSDIQRCRFKFGKDHVPWIENFILELNRFDGLPELRIVQFDYRDELCHPNNERNRRYIVHKTVEAAKNCGICVKFDPWRVNEWGEEPRVSS